MPIEHGVAEDRAPFLGPDVVYDQPDDVAEVEALKDWRVRVRFNDGVQGVVDLKRQVHADDAGVFSTLSDPRRFAQASVANGTVCWPGEIDLAPDAIYAELKADGCWEP